VLFIAAAMMAVSSPSPCGETWPQRTVKIIVPLPAGGGTDLAVRLFAGELSRRWAQPVVVENRPGPDGLVGVSSFVNARDDHQLLFSFAGPITINPLIHEKLPYDPDRDLVPIATIIDNFFAIAVSTATGVQSVDAFVSAARASPERFNWAATAGLPQFVFQAFQKKNSLKLTQVPYRDLSPALQDLSENRIQVFVTGAAILLPTAATGKTRLLMVTNRQRSPVAPEVPTAEELGFPDLTFEGVVGLFGGRDMLPGVRDRIAADVAAVGASAEIDARLRAVGVAIRTGTPAQFSAAIDEQRDKVRGIAASTNAIR
jgi:tripartite-type tricarboxylate transporter receptor subunit TctC